MDSPRESICLSAIKRAKQFNNYGWENSANVRFDTQRDQDRRCGWPDHNPHRSEQKFHPSDDMWSAFT
jgi:hypothetical protein